MLLGMVVIVTPSRVNGLGVCAGQAGFEEGVLAIDAGVEETHCRCVLWWWRDVIAYLGYKLGLSSRFENHVLAGQLLRLTELCNEEE
jgi:hypothetical protein